jgi:hypothetical protein
MRRPRPSSAACTATDVRSSDRPCRIGPWASSPARPTPSRTNSSASRPSTTSSSRTATSASRGCRCTARRTTRSATTASSPISPSTTTTPTTAAAAPAWPVGSSATTFRSPSARRSPSSTPTASPASCPTSSSTAAKRPRRSATAPTRWRRSSGRSCARAGERPRSPPAPGTPLSLAPPASTSTTTSRRRCRASAAATRPASSSSKAWTTRTTSSASTAPGMSRSAPSGSSTATACSATSRSRSTISRLLPGQRSPADGADRPGLRPEAAASASPTASQERRRPLRVRPQLRLHAVVASRTSAPTKTSGGGPTTSSSAPSSTTWASSSAARPTSSATSPTAPTSRRGPARTPTRSAQTVREGGVIPSKRDGADRPDPGPEMPDLRREHADARWSSSRCSASRPTPPGASPAPPPAPTEASMLQPLIEYTAMKQLNWQAGLSRLFAMAFQMVEQKMAGTVNLPRRQARQGRPASPLRPHPRPDRRPARGRHR